MSASCASLCARPPAPAAPVRCRSARSSSDPTAHAEVVTLRRAARRIGNYRLPGTTLYVTVEPCVMCAGALVQARVARVVFGASDPKGGAARTLYRILDDPRLNHRAEVVGGVLEAECREMIQKFFRSKRTGTDFTSVPGRGA